MGWINKIATSLGMVQEPPDYLKIDEKRDEADPQPDGKGRLKSAEFETRHWRLLLDLDGQNARMSTDQGYLSDGRSGTKVVSRDGPFDLDMAFEKQEMADLVIEVEPETKSEKHDVVHSHQEVVPVWVSGGLAALGQRTVITGFASSTSTTTTGNFQLRMKWWARQPAFVTMHGYNNHLGERRFDLAIQRGDLIKDHHVWASPSSAFSPEIAENLQKAISPILFGIKQRREVEEKRMVDEAKANNKCRSK